MAILIANPNSTASMTASMVAAASAAAPDLAVEGWTSPDGPAAIQGAEDGAAAVPPLLAMLGSRVGRAADGVVIGCFDDTGLDAAARLARGPVLGIGQAAFHLAALRRWRFGVVTTLDVSVPVIADNIVRYGLWGQCAGVRASGVPVLSLDADPDAAIGPVMAQARAAVDEDGAQAIVLGCAGMVHVSRAVADLLAVPVIDPVEAAMGAMVWALGQGGRP